MITNFSTDLVNPKPDTNDFPLSEASLTDGVPSHTPRNARRFLLQNHLPDRLAPYHGSSHPFDVLERARELTARAEECGYQIDWESLELACYLHDVLHYLNPREFGFDSSEALSEEMARYFLQRENVSYRTIEKVCQLIRCTHSDTLPRTPEEQIIRAADLGGLIEPFESFRAASEALRQETSEEDPLKSFQKQLGVLRKYLLPYLHLTPEACDRKGRSLFHQKAIENIVTYLRELLEKNAQALKVVVRHSNIENLVRAHEGKETFTLEMHIEDSYENRKRILQELHHTDSKVRESLVVPGTATAIPLYSNSADEVHCYKINILRLQEASRILRGGGKAYFYLKDLAEFEAWSKAVKKCGFEYSEEVFHDQFKVVCLQKRNENLTAFERKDTLTEWENALKDSGHSRDAKKLRLSMEERYQRVREMGLPTTPTITLPLRNFLSSPEETLRALSSEDIFLFAEKQGLPSIHMAVTKHNIVSVLENIALDWPEDEVDLTLQQAYPIVFNGNILVNRSGGLRAEFTPGNSLPSRQNCHIDFSCANDEWSGGLKYSTTDAVKRRIAHGAIRYIAKSQNRGRSEYLPGYYEVAVTEGDEGYRYLFFDYRDDEFFCG